MTTTTTQPTLAQRRETIWASSTRGYDENGLHYVEKLRRLEAAVRAAAVL